MYSRVINLKEKVGAKFGLARVGKVWTVLHPTVQGRVGCYLLRVRRTVGLGEKA